MENNYVNHKVYQVTLGKVWVLEYRYLVLGIS